MNIISFLESWYIGLFKPAVPKGQLLAWDGATAIRLELSVSRWLLGIVPVFCFREAGHVSVKTTVLECTKTLSRKTGNNLKSLTEKVFSDKSGIVMGPLAESLNTVALEITKLHSVTIGAELDGFVGKVSAGAQAATRKHILDFLRQRGAGVFAALASRDLGNLLTRLKARADSLHSTGPTTLPLGARFCYQNGAKTVVVVEQMPQVRTYQYDARCYSVAFPYVIFVVTVMNGCFQDIRIFFRNESLRHEDNVLYSTGMPNVHPEGRICMGTNRIGSRTDPLTIVDDAIQTFWGSKSTGAIQREVFDIIGGDVETWERLSRENPQFVLEMKWTPYKSLKTVVTEAFGGQQAGGPESIDESIQRASKEFGASFQEQAHLAVANLPLPPVESKEEASAAFGASLAKLTETFAEKIHSAAHAAFSARKLGSAYKKALRKVLTAIVQDINEWGVRLNTRLGVITPETQNNANNQQEEN